MNPIVRRVIILGTPLVLGILDLFHPTLSTGVFADISDRLVWWITVHILQLPLFCLLALSVYLLLDGVQGTLATLSRVALGIFVIFYPAMDAILGIGTGALVSYANGISGLPQAATVPAIEDYFSNRVTILVGTVGNFGWAIGILLAVLALSRPAPAISRLQWSRWLVIVAAVLAALAISYFQLVRNNAIPMVLSSENLSRLTLLLAIALGLLVRPHLPAGLLVMAAYLFSVDHALPTGPAAMACYFVAALQLECFSEKVPLVEEGPAPAEEDATPAKQDAATTQEDVISAEQDATTTEDVVPDPS